MYKENLALNNLQGFICLKTQPNEQTYLEVHNVDKVHIIILCLHLSNQVSSRLVGFAAS